MTKDEKVRVWSQKTFHNYDQEKTNLHMVIKRRFGL